MLHSSTNPACVQYPREDGPDWSRWVVRALLAFLLVGAGYEVGRSVETEAAYLRGFLQAFPLDCPRLPPAGASGPAPALAGAGAAGAG